MDPSGEMSPDELLMSPQWDQYLQRIQEEEETEPKDLPFTED